MSAREVSEIPPHTSHQAAAIQSESQVTMSGIEESATTLIREGLPLVSEMEVAIQNTPNLEVCCAVFLFLQ